MSAIKTKRDDYKSSKIMNIDQLQTISYKSELELTSLNKGYTDIHHHVAHLKAQYSEVCQQNLPHHVTQEVQSYVSSPYYLNNNSSHNTVYVMNDMSHSMKNLDLTYVRQFVRTFKQRRKKLGLTQTNAAQALGSFNGIILSQTTICRFETMKLPLNVMLKLIPFIEKLMDTAFHTLEYCTTNKAIEVLGKKRKTRTPILGSIKEALEIYFYKEPKPSKQELSAMAAYHQLEYKVVQVWFSNRRQIFQRMKPPVMDNARKQNYHTHRTVPKLNVPHNPKYASNYNQLSSGELNPELAYPVYLPKDMYSSSMYFLQQHSQTRTSLKDSILHISNINLDLFDAI